VIAQKLRVKWLLEGEIDTLDGRISVAVKLTNVALNRSIWSRQFWENERDPFEIHDAIAAEVAKQLLSTLSQRNTKLLMRRPTESMEAHQLYANGRNYWNQRTETGLLKAIEYFTRASKADTEFAPAYAGLADCHNLLSYYSGLAPKDVFPKALAFANKALEIDDRLAEAHTSRSYAISRYYWKWQDAELGYKRAIDLNASYPSAHQWYAEHLTAMGRFDEAQREVRQARLLDPLSPVIAAAEGTVFYFARHYDEAIELYRKAIEERPDFVRTRFRLARAYVQKGMFKEAITECMNALKRPGKTKEIVQLGQTYAMANQPAQAARIIMQLERLSKRSYVSEYNVAIIYVGLGDFTMAFRWLELAFASRDPWLEHLNVDPRLDDLRSEVRFRELLRRMPF
jgi:tetratricopeptide (TPR) repeat protein